LEEWHPNFRDSHVLSTSKSDGGEKSGGTSKKSQNQGKGLDKSTQEKWTHVRHGKRKKTAGKERS